jgi:uncharacterized protein (DUF885 family)
MKKTIAESLLALGIACLCLQAGAGRAVAQEKKPASPEVSVSLHQVSSVEARLAAQNALFKQQFEDDRKASPESETAGGDYQDNATLDDYSIAASIKQNAVDRAYRAKLAAISTEGFPEQDRLSHDLLIHVLDDRITD